ALASLLNGDAWGAPEARPAGSAGALKRLDFTPRAKRVIYLFQSGGPSHLDLFDYKPGLTKVNGEERPDSVPRGQRLTGMTADEKTKPVAASICSFARHGGNGTWISELLPHTARIVDEIALIRTMTTSAINHDPAVTFCQTGSEQPGRPTLGAWLSYGLG